MCVCVGGCACFNVYSDTSLKRCLDLRQCSHALTHKNIAIMFSMCPHLHCVSVGCTPLSILVDIMVNSVVVVHSLSKHQTLGCLVPVNVRLTALCSVTLTE